MYHLMQEKADGKVTMGDSHEVFPSKTLNKGCPTQLNILHWYTIRGFRESAWAMGYGLGYSSAWQVRTIGQMVSSYVN